MFDDPVSLAEGTPVRVEPLVKESPPSDGSLSLLERLGDAVGAIEDLPADAAAEHDHYLYGAPKRT